jgi:hypothetical protein
MNDDPNKERVRIHPDNYWTLRNKLILVTTLISSLGLTLSLLSLYLASKASTTSSATQRELREKDFERQRVLKESDLRQYCQRRYDDLAYETARVKSESDAKGYYKRFWDLQFEQYQYCKDGLVDKNIFATWMASRRFEYVDNEPVGQMSYQRGWEYMSDRFKKHDNGNQGAYTEFVNFMNAVFQSKKATCDTASK